MKNLSYEGLWFVPRDQGERIVVWHFIKELPNGRYLVEANEVDLFNDGYAKVEDCPDEQFNVLPSDDGVYVDHKHFVQIAVAKNAMVGCYPGVKRKKRHYE